MNLYPRVFAQFNRRKVRYVVVGGLAVVLHGHARLTMDVDVIVALDHENARAAIESLLELGFSSRIPEDPLGFASAQRRSQWIDEKHMMVLTMIDPSNPFFAIDLFIDPPIAYEELAKEAEVKLLGGVEVAVCSLEDLLRMKRLSGRSEDMADIEALGGLD